MKYMKEKIKNNYCIIIPAVLTVIILLLTYIVKGVYPFGDSNISYYDMNQGCIAAYGRAYEVFHGKDSLIFDWMEGAGEDMTSSFQGSILHPLNWIFLFLDTDHILNFMALFFMIKLVLSSLGISYYLKKVYTLPLTMHISLSMLYTFSGYVLQYYSNLSYIDSMMLLPPIVLSLRYMHEKGKCFPYFLLMTFELLTSQYFGFMILLFVLFYSFGLSLTQPSGNGRKVFAARLGLTTFTSIAAAAVTIIPAVKKWSQISRTSESSFSLSDIFHSTMTAFFEQKEFMFFNTELAGVICIFLLANAVIRKKHMSKESAFRVYMFILFIMPILNEGTNLLWHMGSYVHFPFRSAFMLTFAGIELVAHQWEHGGEPPRIAVRSRNELVIISVCAAAIAAFSFILSLKMDLTFVDYGIHQQEASYDNAVMIFIMNMILYVVILIAFEKKLRELLIFIIMTVQTVTASVCFIAPLKYSQKDEYVYYNTRDQYIRDSAMIKNSAELENDYLSRIKTLYPCLARNYSMMLDMPSTNQWLYESVAAYLDEMGSLGYGVYAMANYDYGGTLFSDALLNNKKVIVYGDVYVPERVYTKYASVGDYSIYDMNYTLPFGMLTDEGILDTDCEDVPSAVHQEQLAKAFCGDDIQLFREVDMSQAEQIENTSDSPASTARFELDIRSDSLLYVSSKTNFKITVNGDEVTFPYYDRTDNPNPIGSSISDLHFIRCLSAGDKAVVEISPYFDDPEICKLLLLDLDAMEKLGEKYRASSVTSYSVDDNRLDLTADVGENKYLFLPLEYLEGWSADVNGEKAEILPVMNGAFMAVRLPEGHCEITMKYMPSSLIQGAAVSAVGIIAAAFFFIMKKRGKEVAEIPFVSKTAYVIFNAVAAAALLIMYILPILL